MKNVDNILNTANRFFNSYCYKVYKNSVAFDVNGHKFTLPLSTMNIEKIMRREKSIVKEKSIKNSRRNKLQSIELSKSIYSLQQGV